jgi:CRISPR/Cas system-associated protein endoribonuclease Cas2
MNKPFTYLVLSDIHLFHGRTKTHEIIQNLDTFFHHYDGSVWNGLDLIIIAGDLFDQPIDLGTHEVNEACTWLIRLMYFCNQFKIALRIMEGTPSHDARQSRITEILNKRFPDLDYKYINDISIDRIVSKSNLIIDTLYVPDKIRDNERLVFEDVKELMREKCLDQVHISVTHGMYGHLCSYSINTDHLHLEDDYLNITKHFVSNGHVHTFCVYDRIITEGSFDRLAQGEEEAKGAVYFEIYLDNPSSDKFVFVENKHAKIYKALTLKSMDIDKSLAQVHRVFDTLPIGSYAEIRAKKDHPLILGFSEIKQSYPQLNVTKKIIDTSKLIKESKTVTPITEFKSLPINKDNIVELIMGGLQQSKYPVDELLDVKAELESLI